MQPGGSACTAIAGAVGAGYTPASVTVGATIRVRVSASNASGEGAPATSEATAQVLPAPPAATAVPTITGVPAEGQQLVEHPASWTNSPTARRVAWLRCEGSACSDIEGASSQTYTPTAADIGDTISVRETASNAGGWNASSSESTALVTLLPPPRPREAPEFGRCVAMKGSGAFSTATCTTSGNKAAFEWEPQLLATGFTVAGGAASIETVAKSSIACTTVSGQGSYTGPREATWQLTLSGCELSSQKCTSPGASGRGSAQCCTVRDARLGTALEQACRRAAEPPDGWHGAAAGAVRVGRPSK